MKEILKKVSVILKEETTAQISSGNTKYDQINFEEIRRDSSSNFSLKINKLESVCKQTLQTSNYGYQNGSFVFVYDK